MQIATPSPPDTPFSSRQAPIFTVLLVIMLLALATSLADAEWAAGMNLLTPIVLAGFLLGLAMSYSRWDGLWPVLVSLVIGLAAVLHWVGQSQK